MTISLRGIDIGKNNFHLFGIDEQGKKQSEKSCPERTCWNILPTSNLVWLSWKLVVARTTCARLLMEYGHNVKLISSQFVKPCVKTNKNDYNAAEAITEAPTRPCMHFVPVKTSEQQAWQLLHPSLPSASS